MTDIASLVDSVLSVQDVEYTPLGSILDYEQPGPYIVKSTEYVGSGVPVLTAGQSFILGYTQETEGICKASPEQPVIIFDDFTTSFHYVDFDFKVKSSAMKILRSKVGDSFTTKYAYYCMQQIEYVPQEHSRQWISVYSDFEIPCPSMEVQRAIVEILDSFSCLVDDCVNELSLRRVQKDYLRGLVVDMFESDSSVKKVLVKDIAALARTTIPMAQIDPKQYVGVENLVSGGGLIVTNSAPKVNTCLSFKKDDILIGNIRPYLKKIWFADFDGGTNGDVVIISPMKQRILPKYLYYLMNSDQFFSYDNQYAKGGKMPRGDRDMISQFEVPLPSLDVQAEIVNSLSVIDSYIDNLCDELSNRVAQYEYYMNYLLAFGE